MISRRLLRIKIVKALYSHFRSEGESLTTSQRNLLFSIHKSYDLYHLMLSLVVDVADYAENVIEQRKTKLRPTEEDLNPNRRFVDNKVIAQLRASKSLNGYLQKNSLTWSASPELIRKLYQNLTQSDYYARYMQSAENGYNADKSLVIEFYSREIEDFEYIYEVLEDMSIYWLDELEFITSQVIKTIRSFRSGQATEGRDDIGLLPMVKDEEDIDFAKNVFSKAIVNYKKNLDYIESFVKNWDIDRIAFMDKILLVAALVEITECPTIPVNVTMDEYIEISKYYSSPTSGYFINGLLDKLVADLSKNDRIKKLV